MALLAGVGAASVYLAWQKAEEKLGRVELPIVTESVHEDKVMMVSLKHFCNTVENPDRIPMVRKMVLYTDRIHYRYKRLAKENPSKVQNKDAIFVNAHIEMIHDCVQALVAEVRERGEVERSAKIVIAYESIHKHLNGYLVAIVGAGLKNHSITNEKIYAKQKRAYLRKKKRMEHEQSVFGGRRKKQN